MRKTACSCGSGAPVGDAFSCPFCGTAGKTVPATTVALHVREELRHAVTDSVYRFCETAECSVVYYGPPGTASLRKQDLKTRVGVKEAEDPIPVCYCFSFTEREVIEDFAAHGRSTIRNHIKQKVRDGECACETKNPSGRCCLGNVGRAIKKASLVASPTKAIG